MAVAKLRSRRNFPRSIDRLNSQKAVASAQTPNATTRFSRCDKPMIEGNRRKLLATLLALPALAAATTAGGRTKLPKVPRMKTHASGRHLIDLPVGFEIAEGSTATLYFGIDSDAPQIRCTLLAAHATQEAWAALVSKRSAVLANARHHTLGLPMLVAERAIAPGRTHLFRSFEDPQLSHVLRSEAFCMTGGAIAHLEAESYRISPEEAEDRLLQLATGVVAPVPEDAAGPGLALGPLRIVSNHVQEIATLNYRHRDHADLLFTLRIDAMSATAKPTLLQRWDQKQPVLARVLPGWPRTLRRGPCLLGGMGAEELLTSAMLNGRRVLKFSAESSRPHPAFATPLLTLALDSEPAGAPEHWPPAAWGEAEAVQVWDAAMQSVRQRPGSI